MEECDLLEAMPLQEELKSVIIMCGELFAMTRGI